MSALFRRGHSIARLAASQRRRLQIDNAGIDERISARQALFEGLKAAQRSGKAAVIVKLKAPTGSTDRRWRNDERSDGKDQATKRQMAHFNSPCMQTRTHAYTAVCSGHLDS
jgi:hypothetical protein